MQIRNMPINLNVNYSKRKIKRNATNIVSFNGIKIKPSSNKIDKKVFLLGTLKEAKRLINNLNPFCSKHIFTDGQVIGKNNLFYKGKLKFYQ